MSRAFSESRHDKDGSRPLATQSTLTILTRSNAPFLWVVGRSRRYTQCGPKIRDMKERISREKVRGKLGEADPCRAMERKSGVSR